MTAQASLQTDLNQPMTLDTLWRISQNHTMLWGWRGPLEVIWCSKHRGHPAQTVATSKIEPTLKLHQVAECHNQGSCNSARTRVPQPFWCATPPHCLTTLMTKNCSLSPSQNVSWGNVCLCPFLCTPL